MTVHGDRESLLGLRCEYLAQLLRSEIGVQFVGAFSRSDGEW
ncbi:hypothetical protein [Leucobacter salsicius]|nr:hypothetical protein [Leucobacter salsicius]